MNKIHDVNIHENRNSFGNRVSYMLNYTLDNTIGFNLYPRTDSNPPQEQRNTSGVNTNHNQHLQNQNIQNKGGPMWCNINPQNNINLQRGVTNVQNTRNSDSFTVSHNNRGEAIIKYDAELDDEAENEHKKQRFNMNLSDDDVEKYFGIGIRLYFNFLKFLIKGNFALFLVSLLIVIPHINTSISLNLKNVAGEKSNILDYLFISTLQEKDKPYWITFMVLTQIIAFLFAPLYSLKTKKFFKDKNINDDDDIQIESDIIEENKQYTQSRKLRKIISLSIFLASLAIPISITYFMLVNVAPKAYEINLFNKFKYVQYIQLALAAACSGIVSIFNLLWKKTCLKLTNFEKHDTYTNFRRFNLFKLVIFKVASLFSLYTIRYMVDQYRNSCMVYAMAVQYLLLFLLEITIGNVGEIFIPKLINLYRKSKNQRKENPDSDFQPEFDTSEEYLELIYRQYILYVAMSIFPLVILIGLLANIIELYIDKYKLFKQCQKPPRTRASNRKFLIGYLMLMWFLALVTPPTGAIYYSPSIRLLCFPCISYDLEPLNTCVSNSSLVGSQDLTNYKIEQLYTTNRGILNLIGLISYKNFGLDSLNINGLFSKMIFNDDYSYWSLRGTLIRFVNNTYRHTLVQSVNKVDREKIINDGKETNILISYINKLFYVERCKCQPCMYALERYLFKYDSTINKGPCDVSECYVLNQLVGRYGICWKGSFCPSGHGYCKGNDEPWKAENVNDRCSTGSEINSMDIVSNNGPCLQFTFDPTRCNATNLCKMTGNVGNIFGNRCEQSITDNNLLNSC